MMVQMYLRWLGVGQLAPIVTLGPQPGGKECSSSSKSPVIGASNAASAGSEDMSPARLVSSSHGTWLGLQLSSIGEATGS
jgi:hypothetical protein